MLSITIAPRSYPVSNVLDILLIDRTTRRNIIFATDSYAEKGELYTARSQISRQLLEAGSECFIQPRVLKALEEQQSRTRKRAEVFTPKRVVKMMVDELEKQNPGCFDDPTKTFADLYMKSGLYITEIVKRLYNNPAMKRAIPDDHKRVRHILQKQVYGMAPTRIIYLIATNYILGFDEEMRAETHNFAKADAAEASKNGMLVELVNKTFG